MAAEEWQVQLVRDELIRATDTGQQRSRHQLQEACGLGAGDLDAALEVLRGTGEATEVAPDAFEAFSEEVRQAREAAKAAAEEAPAEELPGRPAQPEYDDELPSLADAERAAGRGAPSRGGMLAAPEKKIELPWEVANALDEAGLGKMVKAGIDAAKTDAARFVLVVIP